MLVAFLGPLSRPKFQSVFPGVQRYPFQRPGTNPTKPYRTPITRYIQKLPPVRRGHRSLFLCSMLCTCATGESQPNLDGDMHDKLGSLEP